MCVVGEYAAEASKNGVKGAVGVDSCAAPELGRDGDSARGRRLGATTSAAGHDGAFPRRAAGWLPGELLARSRAVRRAARRRLSSLWQSRLNLWLDAMLSIRCFSPALSCARVTFAASRLVSFLAASVAWCAPELVVCCARSRRAGVAEQPCGANGHGTRSSGHTCWWSPSWPRRKLEPQPRPPTLQCTLTPAHVFWCVLTWLAVTRALHRLQETSLSGPAATEPWRTNTVMRSVRLRLRRKDARRDGLRATQQNAARKDLHGPRHHPLPGSPRHRSRPSAPFAQLTLVLMGGQVHARDLFAAAAVAARDAFKLAGLEVALAVPELAHPSAGPPGC